MGHIKIRLIVAALSVMIIFLSIYFLACASSIPSERYKLKTIFEKDFSNQNNEDRLILFNNNKFILKGPSPFSPVAGQWYNIPPILYVDNFENIYILGTERIEVFDSSGNSILKFFIPNDSLELDYYSWNDQILYLFFKKNSLNLDYEIYLMNVNLRKTKKLSQNDSQLLSSEIYPPASRKEMAQARAYVRSITDVNGDFYGIGWGVGEYSLLTKDNERYVDPMEILVLKFDRSYDEFYSGPLTTEFISMHPDTYEKYSYENIPIDKLFDEKIVCIGRRNLYVDKKGNVFLIGIKSNNGNRIINNETNQILVNNPILFLAKLENK